MGTEVAVPVIFRLGIPSSAWSAIMPKHPWSCSAPWLEQRCHHGPQQQNGVPLWHWSWGARGGHSHTVGMEHASPVWIMAGHRMGSLCVQT